MCDSYDLNWDIFCHDRPVDQDGVLLPAFADKDIRFWKGDGLFVVSGPASLGAKITQKH